MTGPRDEIELDGVSNLVLTWAEEVRRQIKRVHDVRQRFHEMDRANEWMEEWSPTDAELAESFRHLWAAEHTLVWSSHQLERWVTRNAKDRGEKIPASNQYLKMARDALEHLDEATFEDGVAKPGASSGRIGRALRQLPGQQLSIILGGRKLFQLLDPAELERQALRVVEQVEEALEARGLALLDLSDE